MRNAKTYDKHISEREQKRGGSDFGGRGEGGGRLEKRRLQRRLTHNGGFHIFAREWHRASLNRVNGRAQRGDDGGLVSTAATASATNKRARVG